ncbi:hypothetical protein YC2023_009887 [Brassica napus]
MVNFLWTYSHGWILVDKFYDGHQGFGQRVMDKRTMMDIKVLDREKRLNGAMAVRKRVRLSRLKTTTSRLQAMGAMVNGGRGLKPKEGQWKNFVVAEDLRWKAVNDLTETMA